MTLTDWILDIALVAVVVLQLRERRLRLWLVVAPVVVVGWAASQFLRSVPGGGNNLALVTAATVAGLLLGGGSGLLTRVHRTGGGAVMTRATWAAAVLWVLGMGSRLAFQLYVTHGGGLALVRFSEAHAIGIDSWIDAILFMAMAEAVARTAVLGLRWFALERTPGGRRAPAA